MAAIGEETQDIGLSNQEDNQDMVISSQEALCGEPPLTSTKICSTIVVTTEWKEEATENFTLHNTASKATMDPCYNEEFGISILHFMMKLFIKEELIRTIQSEICPNIELPGVGNQKMSG